MKKNERPIPLHGSWPSKTFAVLLKLMRVPPALVVQRTFRKAWGDQLAKAFDLNRVGRLIVNLRDGIFWLIDGQHRLYAFRENGLIDDTAAWDCEVYENLTDAEMAALFIWINGARLPVHSFDSFHVKCGAEFPRETTIRRVVEAQGLKIAQDQRGGSVSCVGALGRIFDTAGEQVLIRVLRTIRDAWNSDAKAFDTQLVLGLGLFFNRYNGLVRDQRLVQVLSRTSRGVRGLLQRAELTRERVGNRKAQCVAATIVDIYNKGIHGKERLPSWWKEGDESKSANKAA